MFNKMKEKYDTSEIYYSDMIRYLSTIDLSNVNTSTNDMEVILLDMTYPGGMARKMNFEAIVIACVMFCVNIYTRYFIITIILSY